jgi:UDP-2,3-diacylglucosamine hydrolase
MKISIISDVHIKKNSDLPDQILSTFFENETVKSSDYIILLGDIFDMLIANHNSYFDDFKNFFNYLELLGNEGKKIIYFEGNHDVHITSLFKTFNAKHRFKYPIEIIKKNKVINFEDKQIYLSHGDDIEVENGMYETWKSFLTSKPVEVFFNLMPSLIINWIGALASSTSKTNGRKSYDFDKNKEKFRKSARVHALKGHDFIISGHSHVKDNYKFMSKGREVVYANNGYAPNEKTFLYFDSGNIRFISLEGSLPE